MKRVAVIDKDRCKPDECNFECGRVCPPNRTERKCITLVDLVVVPGSSSGKKQVADIEESRCVDCNGCVDS